MKSLIVFFLVSAIAFISVPGKVVDVVVIEDGGEINSIIQDFIKSGELDPDAELITHLNTAVDRKLTELGRYMVNNALDPISLPDIHKPFQLPGLVPTRGHITLLSNQMKNNHRLIRDGDVRLDIEEASWRMQIPLRQPQVNVFSNWIVKLDFFPIPLSKTGNVVGTIDNIRALVDIGFNARTNTVSLNRFAVVNMGKPELEVTGDILTDWWANLFVDTATDIVHKSIIEAISDTGNKLAQLAVDNMNRY